jgi:hypothetical protein
LSLHGIFPSYPFELNELLELVRRKLILRKVEFLKWTNDDYPLWDDHEYHLNELLKNIFAFFPDIVLHN